MSWPEVRPDELAEEQACTHQDRRHLHRRLGDGLAAAPFLRLRRRLAASDWPEVRRSSPGLWDEA
jgi:hypothetical protein